MLIFKKYGTYVNALRVSYVVLLGFAQKFIVFVGNISHWFSWYKVAVQEQAQHTHKYPTQCTRIHI